MLSGRRRRQVDEIRVLSLRAQWRIPQWTRALCLSFGLSRLRLSKRWWTAEFGPFGQGTAPPPPRAADVGGRVRQAVTARPANGDEPAPTRSYGFLRLPTTEGKGGGGRSAQHERPGGAGAHRAPVHREREGGGPWRRWSRGTPLPCKTVVPPDVPAPPAGAREGEAGLGWQRCAGQLPPA
jgi:hypothetical protein